MADRPFLRCVDSAPALDPPSVLFQQLSADYPDLPRRVVGEVLSRVYGTAWQSTPEPVPVPQLDSAARALLDAMRARAEDAARRTGRAAPLRAVLTPPDRRGDHLPGSSVPGLRDALDPALDAGGRTRVDRLADALEAWADALGIVTGMSLLCRAAADHLHVAAVAVSVPGDLLNAQTVGAAGALARSLEELQVVLGEGPSHDGLCFGTSLLVEDLTTPQQQARWPQYAPRAVEHGAMAQFVFPMQVGAAHFGVLVLYRQRTGGLRSTESDDAWVFAELGLRWLIDDIAGGPRAGLGEPREQLPFLDDRTEIHQATGMVSVQLGVNLSTALLRIRARAFEEDRSLSALAQAVVARSVRFSPDIDDRNGTGHEERP
jgi:hypothetical protein